MKKKLFSILVFFTAILTISNSTFAQTISDRIFGQNAWMPDSIGSVKYYGQLHKKWGDIQKSSAGVIRYGGIAPDKNKPTKYQYIQMIDSIRSRGMEPIMQVSFNNWQYTATQAAEIVKYVNITMKRNVKCWIIANEPDHVYGFTSSSQVAPYLKSFSSAMKDVDPSIKIIGPETAWYNSGIINGLTSPGGVDDVTGKNSKGYYYVDYISFHTYPFNGSQDRASVISYLTQSGKYNDNLETLNGRLSNCNNYHGRTGDNSVKIAVTEANIDYQNSSSDGIYGVGAMSFLGGQFWAEMLAVSMKNNVEMVNFWSVIEGNSVALNIGFIDKFTGNYQPTYHHFKMMAENFKGTFINGSDNQTNVKAFGSKDGSIVSVMILNQSSSTNHNYTLRLNNSTVSGTNSLKINLNAGIDKEYTDVIDNQSTTLLVFDLAGNILKKCEYKIGDHANKNLPPNCVTYGDVPPTTATASISADGPTTFCTGGNVTLKSDAISGATYQWKKDGVIISGATTNTYVATSTGNYQMNLIVSGVTTASNTISVSSGNTISATITAQGSTSIPNGGSVVLNSNTGTGYTYQWLKNGVVITGATQASYTANAAGDYQVTIKSGACEASSNLVKVDIAVEFAATITADGSTTICNGGNVLLRSNTGTGFVYQWKKNGVAISGATQSTYSATSSGDYQVKIISGSLVAWSAPLTVAVANSLSATVTAQGSTSIPNGGSVVLNSNTGTGYTYQWLKNGVAITNATQASYTANAAGDYQVTIKSGSCEASSNVVTVDIAVEFAATITADGSTTICNGGNVLLRSNTGAGFVYQWKKNGNAISGATQSTFSATSSGDYQVKIISGSLVAWSAPLTVAVANSLSATVTAQGSTSIPNGGSVVLNSNTGTGYTYQWLKNGVLITGATQASYTANAAGDYQVTIKSGSCEASSNVVKVDIAVEFAATITADGSTSICNGGNVLLRSNTGAGFVYQWKKNNVAISGATQSTYSATSSGDYQVKIISGSLVAWSAPLTVAVVNNLSATITAQGSTSIPNGGSVVLNSNTGTGYTYQWYKDGVSISGASQASYTANNEGDYQVTIKSGSCEAISNFVSITMTTTNNLSANITADNLVLGCDGNSVLLKSNTGAGFVYQWKKNGNAISGANQSTYSANSEGEYQVKIISGSLVAWSAPVNVVKGSSLIATITADGPTSIPQGGSVLLKSNTGQGYIYQWKRNGVNISGANSSSYLATKKGDYQVKIISGSCTAWSAPIKVVVTTNTVSSNPLQVDEIDISDIEEVLPISIKAYPNPTSGPITLEIDLSGYSGEAIIEILTSLGQPIYQKSVMINNNKLVEKYMFDSNAGNGVYFVRVMYNEKLHTEKVLLNR